MHNSTNPKEFYIITRKENKLITDKLSQTINRLTVVRLTTFIAVFAVFFVMRETSVAAAIAVAIGLFAFFLFCVVWTQRCKKTRSYHQAIIDICLGEEKALKNDFSHHINGTQYTAHAHPYAYDLDIFGEASVFQFLNRTTLHQGEQKLAEKLKNTETGAKRISELQEAVRELSANPDFCIRFRANSSLIQEEKEETTTVMNWIQSAFPLKNRKVSKLLSRLMPVLLFSTLLLLVINRSFQNLSVFLFLTNLFIISVALKKSNAYNGKMSTVMKLFKKYFQLLQLLENEKWKSDIMKQMQGKLISEDQRASESIGKLNKHINGFDQRMNVFMAIFLEGFFLWDLQYIERIERWKEKYGSHFPEWINALAELDALISLSTTAFNNADFVYPELSENRVVQAKQVAHPLIPAKVRICNDFDLDEKGQFSIITGANMSGKSTFLRTVAVNMILAGAGMPVCAEAFEYTPMKLFSSMRTSDSLAENESYFYAELLRLKLVLEALEKDDNYFIILDEILKGTNSHDKQKGSRMVLEKILNLKGTGIIATHDLELTKIENDYPRRIHNHCFEIDIENEKISFDYKLHNGVTQKMNAILLMQQMGIV